RCALVDTAVAATGTLPSVAGRPVLAGDLRGLGSARSCGAGCRRRRALRLLGLGCRLRRALVDATVAAAGALPRLALRSVLAGDLGGFLAVGRARDKEREADQEQ